MIWILHRGNLHGPNVFEENRPDILKQRVTEGWNVEVDIWVSHGNLFLGHDNPYYECDTEMVEWLKKPEVWIHCKNLEAVNWFSSNSIRCHYHYFAHDKDPVVITSHGIPWLYPGQTILNGIHVMPEWNKKPGVDVLADSVLGYCSDYGPAYWNLLYQR